MDMPLFREDWTTMPVGPLRRDNSARGEYMAMAGQPSSNGWYHASAALSGNPDRDHSPLRILRRGGRSCLSKTAATPAWGFAMVLTRGPEPWRDYRVSAQLRVRGTAPVGLVARYRTARDFYAAVFEDGLFKLLRVAEGVAQVLDSTTSVPPARAATVTLEVAGDQITARAGKVTLTARDGTLIEGGIGLWAEGSLECGVVEVFAPPSELRSLDHRRVGQARRSRQAQQALPSMRLLAEVDVRGHAFGRQLRLADMDGDGRCELLFATADFVEGNARRYPRLAQLSALTLEGRVLWARGNLPANPPILACDLPFQAADRGQGMEIVAAFGSRLTVLDGATGRVRQRASLPKPPRMEAYWDEISSYFGNGHGDDLPRVVPDSLRLCNLTGRTPFGDILAKDAYHCAWGLDGRTLKPLWRHRCNTGHFPFTCDLDGAGRDTVILGYSRLDADGLLVGRLFLGDHPDASFCYRDHRGIRHILHPAGEAGLIDERDDGKVEELHFGHVQHLSVANFVSSHPGLERLIVTFHGNEGTIALLDECNRVLRRVERYAAGAVCQPVNWTGDGRELIAFSPRLGDGGLWNEHLELAVPFPNADRPAKYLEVHDVLGLGVDQLVVWDEERLHVYGPSFERRAGGRRYTPRRSWPNTSNYQVNYSLPHFS